MKKTFDLEAARQGARVCTKDGVHRVFIDFSNRTASRDGTTSYPLFGYILDNGSGSFMTTYFTEDGKCRVKDKSNRFDLVMADDDYIERIKRGEYSTPVWQNPHRIATSENIAAQPFASPADEAYWRKMFAGMAMQGLMADNGYKKLFFEYTDRDCREDMYINATMLSVGMADALIEELKKEKK